MNLVSLGDYEKKAKIHLSRMDWDFVASGALAQHTLKENERSFQRWYIRPRFLRDVSKRDLSTDILGMKIEVPIGIAPMGFQGIAHPDGECATVRAAASEGTIFAQSTSSNSSLEEVAEASPNAVKFLQLYVYKDRNITLSLIKRAEKLGYKAIVVTVDLPVIGVRYANLRNAFKPPAHLKLACFDPFAHLSSSIKSESSNSFHRIVAQIDPSLTWEDIASLKRVTNLPIIVKGILTREDAELSLKSGVDAIWVSNHGGRQTDGAIPTMDALAEVVDTVNGRCEVYADGGFRTGADVFKALALGAKMVFLGRPLFWGLVCDGEQGARNVLEIMKKELDNTMALTGCTSPQDIHKQMVTNIFQSKI